MNSTEAHRIVVQGVERFIQKTLLNLQAQLGVRIDHVEVDTRNFANCNTTILLKTE